MDAILTCRVEQVQYIMPFMTSLNSYIIYYIYAIV